MANILDDTRSFRERAPRSLNIFTKIQVLFGGFFFQFGSGFFWFGMIFTLIFVGQSELVYIFSFDGEWVETSATVEGSSNTFAEVNGAAQYEFLFSYEVEGEEFQGSCYGPFQSSLAGGNTVRIEYRSRNPARSRIVGMTTMVFPIWVMFVLLFPLIGFIFMVLGMRDNIKSLGLLLNGKFTRGKKLSSRATNTRINNRTVYAYEFGFEVNNKTYIAKCKTHLSEKVEDEELEKIIYDKKNPNHSIVYDAMGAAPEIDKFGKLQQAGPLAIRYMLITIIGLLVNGAIYIGMYT